MVFQEQSLLPNISVAENIFLGHEGDAVNLGFFRWGLLKERAATQLAKIGANIPPDAETNSLSFAERQLVEFAKVLTLEERAHDEPVILLDEPTSVLESGELEIILTQIERLKQRASVVFISHRLDEVLRVSDRVYVMTNGRCVAERDPRTCDIGELQLLMLGRELSDQYTRTHAAPKANTGGVPRLAVSGLALEGAYAPVSLALRPGEVLGIAGVEGSGREQLCRTLFGAVRPSAGTIEVDGRALTFASPADAVKSGIGYIPAERRAEGIIAGLSVKENMTLAHPEVVSRGPILDPGKEAGIVRQWIERLNIKTPSPDATAGNLSGGNQQKVVVAKWLLAKDLKVLILDHPMRGLDVGAKAEIFTLIRELSAQGIAVLLIADTLDEMLALSDTILVMRDGVATERFDASATPPTRLQILQGMI